MNVHMSRLGEQIIMSMFCLCTVQLNTPNKHELQLKYQPWICKQ